MKEVWREVVGYKQNTSALYKTQPVKQLDYKTGKLVAKFSSITEATKKTGIGHIFAVCRSSRPIAGGYKWEYIGEALN